MYLKQDLYDIYNEKLVSKGQRLTQDLVHELIQLGEQRAAKLIPLKKTSIFKDKDLVFDDKRYRSIFASAQVRKDVTDLLVQLKLEEPIIDELLHMKKSHPHTYRHVQLIAALTINMIAHLAHPKYNPLLAAHLAFTHDIGKTRISQKILNKEKALTEEEYQTIQTHPTIGYLLLNYYCGWEGEKYCWTSYEHHEKLDGSGYPRGIKKIDSYAQLITPVDIFDALISDRPYRKTPFDIRLALDFLLDGVTAGQLQKDSVYSLINCLRRHKVFPIKLMKVSQKKRSQPPQDSVYGKHLKAVTWLKQD